MTRREFIAFVKDVAEHPEHLADYRKIYKNVYPFSDGIFKMLMANEAKPERTVKFLNAMLGLTGDKAIKNYTLGVPENPGVLNDKTAIFDIYGTWSKLRNSLPSRTVLRPKSENSPIGPKCYGSSVMFSKKRKSPKKS